MPLFEVTGGSLIPFRPVRPGAAFCAEGIDDLRWGDLDVAPCGVYLSFVGSPSVASLAESMPISTRSN